MVTGEVESAEQMGQKPLEAVACEGYNCNWEQSDYTLTQFLFQLCHTSPAARVIGFLVVYLPTVVSPKLLCCKISQREKLATILKLAQNLVISSVFHIVV